MNLLERNFESEFSFKASRSGGKGGQNVNKVETKIELVFDITNSIILTDDEKDRIIIKLRNRINKDGILRIVSQSERTQFLNKVRVKEKFYELLEKALKEEKKRKKTKLSKAKKEKRLSDKKKASLKKVMRKLSSKDIGE